MEPKPELRARGTDLCMSESMPFQQHFEYRTTWPLAEVLTDMFFLPVRDQLRAGDSITLCRYDCADNTHHVATLIEIANVRVVASGRDRKNVPLAVVGGVVTLDAAADVPTHSYRVEAAKAGKFRLMDGARPMQEFGSRGEAEAALKRLMDA